MHGNPVAGAAEHETGTAGAIVGGILLGAAAQDGPPASFGGPHTRARWAEPGSPGQTAD